MTGAPVARQSRRDAGRRRHRVVRRARCRGRGRGCRGPRSSPRRCRPHADGALADDAAEVVLDRPRAVPGRRHRSRASAGPTAPPPRCAASSPRPGARRGRRRRAARARGATSTLLRIRAGAHGPHARTTGEYAALRGGRWATTGSPRRAALAAESGAIVLLEGPGHGRRRARRAGPAICPTRAARGWPPAGTGDVLTGVIAAFLARGADPFEAAAGAGAYLHGPAADVAGHTGLVAGDLVAAIPARPRATLAGRAAIRMTSFRPAWVDVDLDAIRPTSRRSPPRPRRPRCSPP